MRVGGALTKSAVTSNHMTGIAISTLGKVFGLDAPHSETAAVPYRNLPRVAGALRLAAGKAARAKPARA